MKSHADKSSTPSAVSRSAQPFLARKGEGSFFAPSRQSPAPGIQTKMTVNTPGDKFEQEADRTADTVMRASAMPVNEQRLQRQAGERVQRKDDEKLHRAGGEGAPAVSADVQSGIRDQLTGGQPLGGAQRVQMEPRFGADFSGVRVHTDGQSAALSNQLDARAFTFQNHIFFARDEYQPGTSGGQQLLAHELTHTIQQGAAQTNEAGIQRAPAKAPAPVAMSSEVVNLASGTFSPPQKVHDEIEAQAGKGLAVRVVVKGLTDEGQVRIRADRNKNYSSIGKGSMPLLNPWTQQLGGMHLNFIVAHNEIKNGYASLKPGGGDTNDWMQAVQKTSSLLGGLGLKVGHLPTVVNKFEAGKLTMGVSNLKVEVGGFVDALLNLSIENASKPKIDATADVKVKGVAEGQLKLDNTQDKLAGEISLAVNFKAFSGAAKVKYNADGTVDVGGKAAYNANKLSGEIQFVATDLETANAFARDAIKAAGGKDKIQDAPPPAPVPAPKAGKKQRGLAATGQLAFNLTTWFAGTVNVVADAKGDITVIGKIAPPGEILLFKQRDWDKELIKFEAKAYYGLPVVGNLNLFANISLHALASLGPAKLYQIEILGTYSTDPEIQKNIQISGSFNISAYAGLRLRAEGGLGIEILSHDLKFGVGVNADVGVKAYADARPTVGYRDPGEFYVSGTIEMVAQPMLGLSGDFFIELETPWWSPLSDDKWVWPLFSKEWPLTDPIGLKAVVKEYVLGSGKVPEIELKPPEFDPSKFMTNMVDRTLPDKSSGKGGGQGTFKDDGTVPPPVVPPKKPEPKKAEAKAGKKGAPPKAGKSGSPDPKAAKDQSNTKILQAAAKDLKALQGKGPYSRAALDDQLKSIKQKTSGISFDVQSKGDNWLVTPVAGKSRGKGLEIKAKDPKDAPKEKKAGKYDGQVGKLVRFTAGKESHRLWIIPNRSRAVVMMATAEKPVSEQLDDLEALAQQTGGNAKTTVIALIATARLRLAELVNAATRLTGDLSNATTNPADIADEDNTVENEEDGMAAIIGQILTSLAAAMSPGPDFPMASAPGIGDIERHGEHDRRIRTGPQIWKTESEHIIPFATGRSLWQALNLYLPERGWPEDNEQTTIVIYWRASRIKTTVDNQVSEHFSSEVENLHIATQLKALLGRYQQGDSTAFSQAPSIMNTILSPLNRAKEHAVERTVAAIAQENAETEAGFAATNRERRGLPGHGEPPKPSQADVARAAKRQYDDVIGLVTREVVSKDELRSRVARMLNRE